jgi:hypothetical protein
MNKFIGYQPRKGYQYVHVGRLERAVPQRKPGVREAYQKVGAVVQINGQPFIEVADSDYAAIRREFALAKPVAVSKAGGSPSTLHQSAAAKTIGLGDALHKVAGPIGRAINWPCLKGDGTTDLKPGSPCDKLRQAVNKVPIRIPRKPPQ